MNAIELADELELKGVSTRVMRLVIAELRRLAEIEQKYLAIISINPVAYISNDKRHLIFADVANKQGWTNDLDALYTLPKD